jgi:hypothetical protein
MSKLNVSGVEFTRLFNGRKFEGSIRLGRGREEASVIYKGERNQKPAKPPARQKHQGRYAVDGSIGFVGDQITCAVTKGIFYDMPPP